MLFRRKLSVVGDCLWVATEIRHVPRESGHTLWMRSLGFHHTHSAHRMNATSWFTAGVLTGVTVTAAPLLYLVMGQPATADKAATGAAVQSVGNDGTPGKAPSMEAATARLEARLDRDGGTAADWELLAKSYDFLGRSVDAARARQHISTAAPAQQHSSDVADTRGKDAAMPSAAEMMLSAGLLMPGAPAIDSASRSITQQPGETAPAPTEISGTVSVESRLSDQVDRGATLFIYAKAADSPGPPLAVLRLTADEWPVRFRLNDSMAMLPSRRLSQFSRVIVEARISRTGHATPAVGDLYVTSTVISPNSRKKLALVINHEIG